LPNKLIGEEKGQITGTRIVPTPEGALTFENSFRTNVRIANVDFANTGTVCGYPRRDGTFYTDGAGVLVSNAGEAVPWWCHGAGRPNGAPPAGAGKVVVFLQGPSKTLDKFTRAPFFVEPTFDEKGNVHAKLYEWETSGSALIMGKDKPTSIRVVELTATGPKIEFAIAGSATIFGNEVSYMGTWTTTPRANGTVFGTGIGVINSPDGDVVPFRGAGIGTPTGRGLAAKYHGSMCCEPSEGKLSKLSAAPLLLEEDVDENGHGTLKVYEYR
jgi:hypothetical protein